MTILSKKKNIQGKQEVEPAEAQQITVQANLQIPNAPNPEERLAQPCWPGSSHEVATHSPHHSYEEFDSLDSGPSHSKRRHRASPLRFSRSVKQRDRVGSGSPSQSGPSSSNAPGPSNQDVCGYNSGDEYDFSHKAQRTEAQWVEEDKLFEKKMRKRGLLVKKMGEDGACLFRAVADQVYGDQEMHRTVRKHCMDYIALNGDYFSQYVTEDFATYVNRKRLDCTHGNHIEMQAISEMYNRTIEVYCYGKEPINIFHGVHKAENEPIRLSYHRGSHYNSIVDPHKATIGVGLGLPGFTPGSAETSLLNDAIRQSEDLHIEQAMLEDKLRATDWEATNEAIEEQVARDSYLQYLRDNEKRGKSMEVGTTSTAAISGEQNGSKSSSPPHDAEQTPLHAEERNTFQLIPPQSLGLSKWDKSSEWESGILATVLAKSQQEYLDNLKKNRQSCSPKRDDDNLPEGPSTSS